MSEYVEKARQYCADVLSGKIVAGKWIKLACQRQVDDLARQSDPTWPFRFDDWEASNVCDFIEKLPHVEGRWSTPTITLEPWQLFILTTAFGWRRRSDGGRRFEQVYVECGRKNAKSALTSGVSLYCLTCDDEPGPQVITAATSGKQARIVFGVAAKMARMTPALRTAFNLEPMANSIVCHQNNGSIQPINAKSSTLDGLNPHLCVLDECAAMKDRSLYDVLRSATGARKSRLYWLITTAGYNLQGVGYEQRGYVAKLLDGAISDEAYLGFIYTLDEGDDPYDEAAWIKANPNLGVSVDIDAMRTYAKQAQNSPASAGEFLTKRLNLWQNAASAWLNMERWKACGDSSLTIDDFVDCPAAIGVDLSDTTDTTALVIVFRRGDILYAFCRFYLPEDLVDACSHRTTTHYKLWSDQGFITTTEGDFIDHGKIEEDIRALCAKYQVKAITLEHYGSAQMAASLVNDNLPASMIHKNGKTFSDYAKLLEAWIEAKRLRHDNNPVLTWMASNCVVDRRVDKSILPKKESKDSPNKIDGIDALLLAIIGDQSMESSISVYESRDLRTLAW